MQAYTKGEGGSVCVSSYVFTYTLDSRRNGREPTVGYIQSWMT